MNLFKGHLILSKVCHTPCLHKNILCKMCPQNLHFLVDKQALFLHQDRYSVIILTVHSNLQANDIFQ